MIPIVMSGVRSKYAAGMSDTHLLAGIDKHGHGLIAREHSRVDRLLLAGQHVRAKQPPELCMSNECCVRVLLQLHSKRHIEISDVYFITGTYQLQRLRAATPTTPGQPSSATAPPVPVTEIT